MIRFCETCKDPATRLVMLNRDGQTATKHYCYVHAVDAGVLEVPLNLLEPVTFGTGYSLNAIIFVLESLVRAECINEEETVVGVMGTLVVAKTALEFCDPSAVRRSSDSNSKHISR